MALDPLSVDLLAFILFCVLSVGYHIYYLIVMRNQPAWSVRVRMHAHRMSWVEMILKRGERITAVQTIRNLIMTNTFLASTMILLVAFIANFVVAQPRAVFPIHEDPTLFLGAMPTNVKGLVLLVLYAFAFVMFLTSLRNLNHLSILIGVDPERLRQTERRDPSLFLAEKLNQVESMSTYGRRAVYYSLPVWGWFLSPWIFAIATVGMWMFFVLVTDFTTPTGKVRLRPGPEPGGGSSAPPGKD